MSEMVGVKSAAILGAMALMLCGCDGDATVPIVKAAHVQCAGTDKVSVGMSRADVLMNCGSPAEINTDVISDGTHEQFVYDMRRDYVYVDSGVVTGFQY